MIFQALLLKRGDCQTAICVTVAIAIMAAGVIIFCALLPTVTP